MTDRWWLWPAVALAAFVVGVASGRFATKPKTVTKTEVREVERVVYVKAEATNTVVTNEVAGPVRTRWRTAPAAPGCPAVAEVVQERGPVARIVNAATKTAMESTAKERKVAHVRVETERQSRFLLGGIGGANAAALLGADRRLWAGAVGGVRLVGPFWLGGGIIGRPSAGVDLGIGGWVTF